MKKLLIFVLLGVFIFFDVFYLLKYLIKTNESNTLKAELSQLKTSATELQANELMQNLCDNIHLIDNPLGDEKEAPKLIIRLNKSIACHACYDTFFFYVSDAIKVIKPENIVVCGDYQIERDFNVDMKINRLENIKKYNLPLGSFKIPIDTISSLYFFVLDENDVARSFFIPMKDFLPRSKAYFEMINKKYFGKPNEFYYERDGNIFFNRNSYNFGKTRKGTHSTSFTLKNNMNSPLIISQVKTSCSCTVPFWEKKPILPGAKSTIKVNVQINQTGYFKKQITIFSNAKNEEAVLYVEGEVVE